VYVCVTAAISNEKERLYGVQFHPEVDLSDNGVAMLKNFLRGVAECRGTFTIKSREDVCIQYIRSAVGSHKVLVRTPQAVLTSLLYSNVMSRYVMYYDVLFFAVL